MPCDSGGCWRQVQTLIPLAPVPPWPQLGQFPHRIQREPNKPSPVGRRGPAAGRQGLPAHPSTLIQRQILGNEENKSQEVVEITEACKQQDDPLLGTASGWGWGEGTLLSLAFLVFAGSVALASESLLLSEPQWADGRG